MPIDYGDSYWETRWASAAGAKSQFKGAILSAGLGRRLDPLTAYHLPKPLFPLGGKVPIAEIWVRRFIESGIANVCLNLCVLGEAIKRHFGHGAKFGVDLSYVEEITPTGTLGGVCKMALGQVVKSLPTDSPPPAVPAFSGSTLIVPSGDIVADFGPEELHEMYEIHRKSGAALSVVLTKVSPSRKKDFGTAVLETQAKRGGMFPVVGRIMEFREKDPDSPGCLGNASIYMVEMELLRVIDGLRTEAKLDQAQPFYDFGKHVFPAMLGRLPYVKLPRDFVLFGMQFDGPWFDVGNKRDYLAVNKSVLDGVINIPLTYEPLPWGFLGTNVSIDFSKVEIRPPVVIGNECVVEPGAVLGPYAVIGDGWVVERGACISHSVLWERYPYFVQGGCEISVSDRRLLDRHQVRRGVHVSESIVAGGLIESDIEGKTVDVREGGEMAVLPIDYLPDEPRA